MTQYRQLLRMIPENQKVGGQVIPPSGTIAPHGAYANGMLVLLRMKAPSRMLRTRKGAVQRKHPGSLPCTLPVHFLWLL